MAKRIIIVFLGVLFLVGCANYRYDPTSGTFKKDIGRDYLSYFRALQDMSGEDLRNEYEKKEQELFATDNLFNKIEFSLLLILPNTTFHDNNRALKILDDVIHREAETDESLEEFAFLLKHLVKRQIENDRVYEDINKRFNNLVNEKQSNELTYKEISKKLSRMMQEKRKKERENTELRNDLKKQEQLVIKLQQKIEQLKAIERNINDRKNLKSPST